MDLAQMEMRMPGVPVDLKYVELRLPGTFRELCANAKFTNDQIGRIVRCIALGTECFVTSEIEPEVFFYRQDQKKRLNAKLRKARSRRKLGQSSSEEGSDAPVAADVPMQPAVRLTRAAAEAAFPDVGPSAPMPPDPEPQTVAHVTQPAPAPASAPAQPAPARRRRTKAEKARDDLSGDLFASVCGKDGKPSDKARAALAPSRETRNDAAWIPGKFSEFWAQYPRKVAKSDAVKAFSKIIKAQPDADKFMAVAMASLAYWKTQDQWTKDNGKFIPYPASWLNAGHWNDCAEDMDQNPGQATFLQGSEESDEDLFKRMRGETYG